MIETTKKKLILIQLNELNFELIKKYSEKYKFKFFNENFFDKLIETKSEKEYQFLEPWIQWVSVYTGLEAKEHGVFRLGDSENKDFNNLYNLIEKKGFSVGAIAPMNLNNKLKRPLYFIPDPWSRLNSDNKWINKFITKIVKKFVNENSSKNKSLKDYFSLLFIVIIFFRFKNFKLLIKILKGIRNHWNKALLFEFILNNIHLKKIKRYNPDFSSIFFNSGAHIQHHYVFNSIFNNKIENPEWYVKKNQDPIFDMIIFYDELLNEYSKNKKYDLILATGLRQIPYDRRKYYYRLKSHENFLKKISVKFEKIIPKMSRDFLIIFKNFDDVAIAEKIFNTINKINNKNIFLIDVRKNSIFVTLAINDEILAGYKIKINSNNTLDLSKYVNLIALKNGMHHEKGYYYSSFKIPTLEKNQHIKKIYQVIKKYFEK